MLASLFPLVDKTYMGRNYGKLAVRGSVDKLIGKLLTMAKGVFNQLKNESQNGQVSAPGQIKTLVLNQKHNEAAFEYLESLLASLNICVSESSLQGMCTVQELTQKDDLLQFVSRDLLCEIKAVYKFQFSRIYVQNYHQNDVSANGGRQANAPDTLVSHG